MKCSKKVSVVMSLLLIISMLSACGGSGTKVTESLQASDGTTTAPTTEATTAAAIPNFNPTGFPIVNEKITLKVMGFTNPSVLDNWNDILFFKYMEELTNIHLEFDVSPEDAFDQKKSIAFASGNLPDMFFKVKPAFKPSEEIKYGGQGLIIRLNELLDQYAPSFKQLAEERPEIYNAIRHTSGNIYTLPQVNSRENYPAYYINTKWLENVGMSMPTNLDEFYEAMKAFKEKDPNKNNKPDEIPMSGYVTATDSSQIKDFIQNFGLMFAPNSSIAPDFFVDDGKVKFSPIEPEYKEALIYLRKLFSEKLLDNDYFTQTLEQVKAKGENYQIGTVDCWAGFTRVGVDYDLEYSVIEPFEYNGKRFWHGSPGVQAGTFAITKENKYPEATIRWVDYLYSEEGGMLLNYGKEGSEWEWVSDDAWNIIKKESETDSEWKARVSIQPGGYTPFKIPSVEFQNKAVTDESGKHLNACRVKLMQYYQEPFPTLLLPEDKQKEVSTLFADISPEVNQMLARFITGDASIENDWDEYVSKLYNMGLEKLIKTIEELYESTK